MNAQLATQLATANRRINGFRAFERLLFVAAVLPAWLALSAGADLAWRFDRAGRLALWGTGLALALAGAACVVKALRRQRSNEAVAALLETHFPELDNRLINHVQMSATPRPTAMEKAYLRDPPPSPAGLRLAKLRRRRLRQWGLGAVLLASIALSAPAMISGPAWNTALQRILNPFSSRAPASFAQVLEVLPGPVEIEQGASLVLSCRATGRGGQTADIDLWPDDDTLQTLRLGRLSGEGEELFEHALPKVTTGMEYRFRIGDAPPTPRYRIDVVPPLAPVRLTIRVQPPEHTAEATLEFEALATAVNAPMHSDLAIAAEFNRPLQRLQAGIDDDPGRDLASDGAVWRGTLHHVTGRVLRLRARDLKGHAITHHCRIELIPDLPPTLRLLQPAGARTALPAGVLPVLAFEAEDDYGVAWVRLERVPADARPSETGQVLKEWQATNGVVAATWQGTLADIRPDAGLRLVAADRSVPTPNRTHSAVLFFEHAAVSSLLDNERRRNEAESESLRQIVDWQKTNLRRTAGLIQDFPSFDSEAWHETHQLQQRILEATTRLLRGDYLPSSVRSLLLRAARGAMPEALSSLARIQTAPGTERSRLASRAYAMQEEVLRLLTQANVQLSQAQASQSSSGLLALIEALVKGQSEVVSTLERGSQGQPLPPLLTDRQDALSVDFGEFLALCAQEAARQEQGDEAMADTLKQVAARGQALGIKTSMLLSAEAIEEARAAAALPPARRALEGLQELLALFNEWRMTDGQERREGLREQVDELNDAMGKLEQLQTTVVESLRPTSSQGDKSANATPDEALMQEIYELKGPMADAALKIATDLQALPELPVSNELVQDVFQVYEAMKQAEGSATNAVREMGLQKEAEVLELLAKASDRLDDMEMWLADAPDNVKRNIENFDQQELPEIGMVAMPEELQDIIGDLLEQQEELQQEADDSTGNQGMSDLPAGWKITEGEFTSYAAKGKSGNERPEHKDQDGKSLVGREGMSDGEVMAGHGKINDGDENIEKRMTRDSSQAGEVEEEDHREAKATGGGKLSGYGEERGMAGEGPRRDFSGNQPSELGRQAMLRRNAETIYAQASLNHLRTGKLDEAIRYMRHAEEAIEQGLPIRQVREFQRRAAAALLQTRADLDAGVSGDALGAQTASGAPDEAVASTPDEAPPIYRDLVAEYFKHLGGER